jgi:hypothetical protein
MAAALIVLVAAGGCSSPVPAGSAAPATGTDETQATFGDVLGSAVDGWDLKSVQSRWLEWSFTGEQLRITRTGVAVPFSGLMRFCLPVPDHTFADFELGLDARSASRGAGIAYGVFVDRSNESRYYFSVDSDGMASVFVEEGSGVMRPEFIQEPVALSSVNTDDANRIIIGAVGSTMTFSVNERQIADVSSTQPGRGPLGLFVEVVPGSDDETWVEFDNLVVQAP